MNERPERDRQREVLPVKQAEELLARASELDVANASGSAIADLRQAAQEAGISAQSFDAALAEMHDVPRKPAVPAPRRTRRRMIIGAVLGFLTAITVNSLRHPSSSLTPASSLVTEDMVLKCITPEDAAQLIRPVLQKPAATVVISGAPGTRVLTVKATRDQMQQAKATIDRYEANSATCQR